MGEGILWGKPAATRVKSDLSLPQSGSNRLVLGISRVRDHRFRIPFAGARVSSIWYRPIRDPIILGFARGGQ